METKLTYSVKEMAQVLGIGIAAAYALVKKPGFPAVHVGKRVVVPVDGLRRWLDEQTN